MKLQSSILSILFIFFLYSLSIGQVTDSAMYYIDYIDENQGNISQRPGQRLFQNTYLKIGNKKHSMYLDPQWLNPTLVLNESKKYNLEYKTETYKQHWTDEYGDPVIKIFNEYKTEVDLIDTVLIDEIINIEISIPNSKSQLIKYCEIKLLIDHKYNELFFTDSNWTDIDSAITQYFNTFEGTDFIVIIDRLSLEVDSYFIDTYEKMAFILSK